MAIIEEKFQGGSVHQYAKLLKLLFYAKTMIEVNNFLYELGKIFGETYFTSGISSARRKYFVNRNPPNISPFIISAGRSSDHPAC